jgi:hypothetical protein
MCYQLKSEENCGEFFFKISKFGFFFSGKKLEYCDEMLSAILRGRQAGDHWQEVLARFGYRSER